MKLARHNIFLFRKYLSVEAALLIRCDDARPCHCENGCKKDTGFASVQNAGNPEY